MRRYLLCLMAVLITACDSPTAPVRWDSLAVRLESAPTSPSVVGTVLTDVVRVRTVDAVTEAEVPSVVVNWFRVAGTDTVFSGASLTNKDGEANFQWHLLGTAGPQAVIAWVLNDEGARVTYAHAEVLAIADAPQTFVQHPVHPVLWWGDSVTARSLVHSVRDRFGNVVDAATITVVPPTGWSSVGDTLLTVPEGPSPLTTLVVGAGAVQSTVPVHVLRDLRRLIGWQVTYTCGDTAQSIPDATEDADPVVADHLSALGTVDSVQYTNTPTLREWSVFTTTMHVRHSDRGDSTYIQGPYTEQWLVTAQAVVSGTLTVPYVRWGPLSASRATLPSPSLVYDSTTTGYTGTGHACQNRSVLPLEGGVITWRPAP